MNHLFQHPLFAHVSFEAFTQWLAHAPCRKECFGRGEQIVQQGDPCRSVYILSRGNIITAMGEGERDLTIDHLEAPEILASAFIYGKTNRFPVTVVAESDCEVWVINKDTFFDFMVAHPNMMRHFMADISNRCAFLSNKVRTFALKTLRARTLEYLVKKGRIDSVQSAAQAMGVQRPSLSRMLSDLAAEGVVERTTEGYEIAHRTK